MKKKVNKNKETMQIEKMPVCCSLSLIEERYFENIISYEIANLLGKHRESTDVMETTQSIKKVLFTEFEVKKRK